MSKREHIGNISIEVIPNGSMPPWQGDHWIIGFSSAHIWDWKEIDRWVDEIEEAGEPPTALTYEFGYAAIIVQRYSTVVEAILKYS